MEQAKSTTASTHENESQVAGNDDNHTSAGETLSDRFHRARCLVETAPEAALKDLLVIQEQVAHLSLFSSNETLEDISTGSLPFVALEHYLAMAYLNVSTMTTTSPPRPDMKARLQNITRACDLWTAFLQRLEQLELLDNDNTSGVPEKRQYHELIEATSTSSSSSSSSTDVFSMLSVDRNVKIARLRAKQALEKQQEHLQALAQRRQRLGLPENAELDGYSDDESLQRDVSIAQLKLCKLQALEEWSSAVRELPMIHRMIQQQQQDDEPSSNSQRHHQQQDARLASRSQAPPPQQQAIQLTQITMNAAGQLQATNLTSKELIRSQVFRPSWNLPTMSLEELAQREVEDARAREEHQRLYAAQQQDAPRRYDQLVKDGREDDADLVDASAALDRNWDDWKDENPRGSGNKRANVGDRNF